MQVLCQIFNLKIFSPNARFAFGVLDGIFQKVFILMRYNLLIKLFCAICFEFLKCLSHFSSFLSLLNLLGWHCLINLFSNHGNVLDSSPFFRQRLMTSINITVLPRARYWLHQTLRTHTCTWGTGQRELTLCTLWFSPHWSSQSNVWTSDFFEQGTKLNSATLPLSLPFP